MRRYSNNIKLESLKDKSTLVKLLAEEDVTVSYQSVPTASFNVETREVTLPIWKDKSEDVMDMMSLHEVGHALYTPMDLMKNGKDKGVEHSFINVLEDVRIEKMIQDKYLGSVRTFKKGYKELISKDFFGTKDKDISRLNLIDRINMHYKNVPNVPFDDDELGIDNVPYDNAFTIFFDYNIDFDLDAIFIDDDESANTLNFYIQENDSN